MPTLASLDDTALVALTVQLDVAQCTVKDGEVALERLEGLVRELHPP